MITKMTTVDNGLRMAAGRGLTPLSERRSPDPARWPNLDSRPVGGRRSKRNPILHRSTGTGAASVCDLLETFVTPKKLNQNCRFFSYFHVYSLILTYSHIKKYFIFATRLHKSLPDGNKLPLNNPVNSTKIPVRFVNGAGWTFAAKPK
jgi:hypothetical protein